MDWNFLQWPNRFEGPLTQPLILDGVYDPIEFPDQDTQITVRLKLSLTEFTKLYSAIVKGAILSYPDEYEQIAWIFLKAFEMPVDPGDCGDVLDCIETSEEVRDEIQKIYQRGTSPGGGSIIGGTDDNDELFGFIRFLVDTMHDAIVDVFEIRATEGLRDRTRLIIEAIPAAELLPFDELAEYGESLLDGIGALFNGQYSTTPETGSRDRISCALFCIARANGNILTWAQIRDYFWQEVGFDSPGLNQFVDFAGYLITGSWAGQDLVNISFANFASAMDASARYGELLFPAMSTLARLGRNDPDPDWEILCTDCAELWSHTWAFDIGEIEGWESSVGDYIPGVGFQSDGAGPYPYTIDIGRDVTWPAGSALTKIYIGATSTTAETGAFRGVYYPGTAFPPETGYDTNTGEYTMIFIANNSNPPRVQIQNSNIFVAGLNTLRFVTLQGTGPEPDWDA